MTSGSSSVDKKVELYVSKLTIEERMLVVLKRELYEGSWSEMLEDLKARMEGRPYIFKLAQRISDDLERIAKLQDFEKENEIDLGKYVEMNP